MALNFHGNQTEQSRGLIIGFLSLMGSQNLLVLKTHFDSIKARFANNFVYGNMLRAVSSLRVFLCSYVLYSFGLILKYIFRIQTGDRKNEPSVQFEESGIHGFGEELVNFLSQSSEYVYDDSDEREREMESTALMESVNDFPEDGIKEGRGGETESSVSEETVSGIPEGSKNREEETEFSVCTEEEAEAEFCVNMKIDSDFLEECRKNEAKETESSLFIDDGSNLHKDCERREEEETTSSDVMVGDTNVPEDSMIRVEKEAESSVSMENDSNVHEDSKRREEEEAERSVLMEEEESKEGEEDEIEGPLLARSKCQYVSARDISGFIEEPTTMSFSFREFYVGPYVSDAKISELKSEEDPVLREEEKISVQEQSFREFPVGPNYSETEISDIKSEHEAVLQEVEQEESVQEQSFPEFHVSPKVSEMEISELKSEGRAVLQEEPREESVQEQRMSHVHSYSDHFSLKSEIFGGSDSSDEDDLDFNDNSFVSDSESESSSSSGLIWANGNKTDDLITYEFLAYQNAFEGFEPLKVIKKLEAEDEYVEFEPGLKNLNSWDTHYFSGKDEDKDEKKGSDNEEEKLGESDSDEEDDDNDLNWEEDDLVEQMKMELRNARQGGLTTILEDEEEEEEEEGEAKESPKMAEDLKPLKIKETLEFKDHIGEIQKVHKSYEEKMRKLDILNYQTMHALGLLQLKDPSAKPLISQNLWARKAQRKWSNPVVEELRREVEVVYVGQVCLSWEFLCWEYKKASDLKNYDSEWSRQYNVVAGEFQLFQVLVQRFIENEPFQGHRIHNYVKNRCVIRNLLQVPAIKDDSMKNMTTRDEEDAVSSGRLAEIIKEAMQVFWEFVRADKDHIGNEIFKVSHHTRTHLKDPAVSDLLMDVRTHLHKKEKKLKEIVRSGNCIVRRFQKQNEDQVELSHEQLVARVELKLISRVLNMSKLRKDELLWCNEKLKRITFVNRKVQVEPSFLLFPF